MHTLVTVVAVLAIVVFVIGRQLRGEPLRGKRLIVLPAVVALVGVTDLGKKDLGPADIACIAVSAALAAGIGVAQGLATRIEVRDGALWSQLPVAGLWLWGALLVSRGVMTVVAHGAGAHVAASTAPLLLVLGINRLAQAAAVAPRALATGAPFAPEKDGTSFLAGTFGR